MALFSKAVLFAAAAAAAAALTPQQRWLEDIRQTNAAYSTARFAILKIDDAVYLKPGQSAWLIATDAANAKVAWRLAPQKAALLEVDYTAGKVALKRSGEAVSFPPEAGGAIALDPYHDVRAQFTQIAPGEMGVRLFAYNQQNPEAKAFAGLSYFHYQPAYVVEAAFAPEPAKPIDFQTSRGWYKRFWRVGVARFALNGAVVSLPLYSGNPSGSDGLSAFFTDETTGKSTYEVGRYLDIAVAGAFPPKTVTLDFNYAYNPNCARSRHYNCPYASDRIPVAIEAGERAPPPH
jgi:hypothetical protein